jgi:hypothetical protein
VGPDEQGWSYTGARTIVAEGARVGVITCRECGAAIVLDPDDDFDPAERHADWHRKLDARR